MPSFKSSFCVSLSLFHYTLFYSVFPFLTMYCTVHNRYSGHPLHHTTTMWTLLPASSFHDIPSRGLLCDKEVMRNASGTAPVFPNVELKSADSMFLALILYLSWQRKDGSMKWPGSLTSQNSNDKKKDSAISVQDEHDCLCAAISSLRNLFQRIGINTTVMGTRDVYCNSGNNRLMTPISSYQMKNNLLCQTNFIW